MRVFLTSSPFSPWKDEEARIPGGLSEANQFIENLSQGWREDSRILIISADPENFEMNDDMEASFGPEFEAVGLSVSEVAVCDYRNEEDIDWLLEETDVVILGGGHVPTQNAFFQRIGLREKLWGFDGTVIGISAGTMNSADVVYAQPELEGESEDPEYERFIQGLGLTDIMVLPHYQKVKDYLLDGKRLYEDITYADSFGNCFYALVDESYILVEEGGAVLYGEAYQIQDGEICQICDWDQAVQIR